MTRFILAVSLLAGCAHTPQPVPDGTDRFRTTQPRADLLCRDEVATGTMFEHRACRSDFDREQNRRVAEAMFRNPR